jgi:hypothetical protein
MSRDPHVDNHLTEDEGAEWPYASLVFFGFFGTGSPAGRRLAFRTTAFIVLSVVSILGLSDGFEAFFPDLLWLLGLPGAVLGMWWSYARYLGSLDELSRTIQLKGFAAAYGAAMTLLAGSLAIAWFDPSPRVPWELLALPVFAEAVRGMALAYVARQSR